MADENPGPRVHVGAGIYALATTTVSSKQVPIGAEVDYEAHLTLDGARLRYVVSELILRQAPGGPPITGELIRTIPVQSIVKIAVAQSTSIGPGGHPGAPRFTDEDIQRLVGQGATDETLTAVARIYVSASLAGEPPAKSVASILEVPQSTAGYWIRRAKDRGLIGGEAHAPAQGKADVQG